MAYRDREESPVSDDDPTLAFSQLSQCTQSSQRGRRVEDYILEHTIGVGEFSKVKAARNVHTGEYVAVKIIPMAAMKANPVLQQEFLIHTKLDHPHVVHMIKFVNSDPEVLYVFLELAAGGELFDRIEPDVGMHSELAKAYFAQLLVGVEYLHSIGVAHRDIKPENILLDAAGSVRITDFGFATDFLDDNGSERVLTTRCGSPPYVAPEVLTGSYRGPPADVWSVGAVLFVLLTGQLPWDSPTHACFEYTAITEGNFDFAPWSSLPPPALALLRTIFVLDPEKRPTIQQIQQCGWLTGDGDDGRKRGRAPVSSSPTRHLAALTVASPSPSPSAKRRRLLPQVSRTTSAFAMSQPELEHVSVAVKAAPTSSAAFCEMAQSQPIRAADLYATAGPSAATQLNEFKEVVERMTRISLDVPAVALFRLIADALEAAGARVRPIPDQFRLLVTYSTRFGQLSLVVRLFRGGTKRVMAEFMRARGDMFEFKKLFKRVKADVEAAALALPPPPSRAPSPPPILALSQC
ncbi:CAMK/CAMKL/CHK1 protein kinase [Thecamonas trahens ATCC 50062]|uniref:non-specific serine/threonine protein kinase n=1 Tax=Thecamonas trahens ATCC 50062 TaxID=461836 RepID=A0A0L0D3D4_THETB|nr:CAMK/CAMKL/CHK1 protein kinase [Thecamonas trahens ATCC 50062]KNC46681.1 CAMK/CAMKL/CHK1 protein kinase [Thecamonas trahens ATCC 50062]|eukprot:XP_013760449.1 CAMK/CAMKL/CHK1 protein kinase [Thecamonas trahens ATCC 50062]